MAKIRALITLVVGKNKEVPPQTICDVSEDEAKRLINLQFAERIGNQNQGGTNAQSDENGSGQSVQSAGNTGNLQGQDNQTDP